MNRASPTLLEFMQYYIDHCPTERGETYQLAKELGGMLIENCREVLDAAPVYKDVQYPHAPKTTIDEKGNINASGNPNGAIHNIAGICNTDRNVFGMMPHPERACNADLGNADGIQVFRELGLLG